MRDMTKVFKPSFVKEHNEQSVKQVGEVGTKFGEIAEIIGRTTPSGYLQQLLLARLWEVNSLAQTAISNGPALTEFEQNYRAA